MNYQLLTINILIIFCSCFFFIQSADSALLRHCAVASPLTDRLQQYPQWNSKPPVKTAHGDLHYPQWMAGTWTVTSTLTEQTAPLAPDIVTPGFKDNQQ